MEMTIEEKIQLNKKLRSYKGLNTFLLSLQEQLKSTKAKKEELSGKQVKVLSDKQIRPSDVKSLLTTYVLLYSPGLVVIRLPAFLFSALRWTWSG